MQVTEVRIKLMEGSEDRLRAFCSITLDHSFVIRDLKVIDGASGPFVAMPSRKLSGHCYRCNYKNHLRAAYCNQCGTKLKVMVPVDSPQKLYADVAHPVNSDCREMISTAVLAEFAAELARAAQPGYRSRYDDDFEAISESHDDLFPIADSHQRLPSRDPQPLAGGSNFRIDHPHDSPRRSSMDPPSASPHQADSPPRLPEGGESEATSGKKSQAAPPPVYPHDEGEQLVIRENADDNNSHRHRIDAVGTKSDRGDLESKPPSDPRLSDSVRQRGSSPPRQVESSTRSSETFIQNDTGDKGGSKPEVGGFGAGIFD